MNENSSMMGRIIASILLSFVVNKLFLNPLLLYVIDLIDQKIKSIEDSRGKRACDNVFNGKKGVSTNSKKKIYGFLKTWLDKAR